MRGREEQRLQGTGVVSSLEEIPYIQGKEQRLCFAGAAVTIPHVQGKRNPSNTVGIARRHQRADTLKP